MIEETLKSLPPRQAQALQEAYDNEGEVNSLLNRGVRHRLTEKGLVAWDGRGYFLTVLGAEVADALVGRPSR